MKIQLETLREIKRNTLIGCGIDYKIGDNAMLFLDKISTSIMIQTLNSTTLKELRLC